MLASLLAALVLLQGPDIPPPRGLVNDFASVVTEASAARMEHIAEEVRTKSAGEMTIVTLPDLEGRDVSEIALRIGREWKVGKLGDPGDAQRNAGAVILLVPKETAGDGVGRCWIATGRGAEGFITDASAGAICREATPFFRERDYGRGLELVTLRVAQAFAKEFGFALDTATVNAAPRVAPTAPRGPPSGGFNPFLFFIIIFVIVSVLNAGRRGGRRRGGLPGIVVLPPIGGGWGGGGWGGGGSWGGGGGGGGGFGGFGGGGGFSGGGGGSNW